MVQFCALGQEQTNSVLVTAGCSIAETAAIKKCKNFAGEDGTRVVFFAQAQIRDA